MKMAAVWRHSLAAAASLLLGGVLGLCVAVLAAVGIAAGRYLLAAQGLAEPCPAPS